jgi:hypothetical protein
MNGVNREIKVRGRARTFTLTLISPVEGEKDIIKIPLPSVGEVR